VDDQWGATTTSHAEKTASLEDVDLPSKAPDAAKDMPESVGEVIRRQPSLSPSNIFAIVHFNSHLFCSFEGMMKPPRWMQSMDI